MFGVWRAVPKSGWRWVGIRHGTIAVILVMVAGQFHLHGTIKPNIGDMQL